MKGLDLARAMLAALCALGASGCNNPDKLMFITKSSFSLEASNKPPAASLGYDRFEGYVGPRIVGEEPPSVAVKFWSGGGFFSPAIRQFYAVGGAADDISGASRSAALSPVVKRREEHCAASPQAQAARMIAGAEATRTPVISATSTSLGLRVGASTTYIDDIMLGFRRKEGTFVRFLQENGRSDRCVPSVLAVFDLNVNAINSAWAEGRGNAFGQFFATGNAARMLALEMSREFEKVDWAPAANGQK